MNQKPLPRAQQNALACAMEIRSDPNHRGRTVAELIELGFYRGCEYGRMNPLDETYDIGDAVDHSRLPAHVTAGLWGEGKFNPQMHASATLTPKEEYLAFHKASCDKMVEITKAKNADYTGGSEDPFANFTKVEGLGICNTEQGFLTRMTDKLCRINSFVQKGDLKVKSESIEDTLLDLANYSILLAGYLRLKQEKKDATYERG